MARSLTEDQDRLQLALAHLAQRDEDLARVVAEHGPPPPRGQKPGFAALLHIIIAQQVSTASAAAISNRLAARLPRQTPRGFLQLDDRDLGEIGFSRQKMVYGRDLARHFVDRRLSIAGLARLSDDDAISALTEVKGIGRWSAEVFLLFSLQRPDIMPAEDLALMVAAQRLKGWDERPKSVELRVMAEPWRPYRSYAARLLWHFYRHMPAL